MDNEIAKYIFSAFDMRTACHQVTIRDEEQFTAFEVFGKLYQFQRILFGETNRVACFQPTTDYIMQVKGHIRLCR